MTCRRKYVFTFPVEVGHAHMRTQLYKACQDHWWYSEPEVRGNGLGVLQVEFNVAARDQWWAHKRAIRLVELAFHGLGIDIPIPTPEWYPLPPHENRGSYRSFR
jgi:hypothetical protein